MYIEVGSLAQLVATLVLGQYNEVTQPRSTQTGHPSVGRCNEYWPKGGDALRLGVKADMVLFAGNTV